MSYYSNSPGRSPNQFTSPTSSLPQGYNYGYPNEYNSQKQNSLNNFPKIQSYSQMSHNQQQNRVQKMSEDINSQHEVPMKEQFENLVKAYQRQIYLESPLCSPGVDSTTFYPTNCYQETKQLETLSDSEECDIFEDGIKEMDQKSMEQSQNQISTNTIQPRVSQSLISQGLSQTSIQFQTQSHSHISHNNQPLCNYSAPLLLEQHQQQQQMTNYSQPTLVNMDMLNSEQNLDSDSLFIVKDEQNSSKEEAERDQYYLQEPVKPKKLKKELSLTIEQDQLDNYQSQQQHQQYQYQTINLHSSFTNQNKSGFEELQQQKQQQNQFLQHQQSTQSPKENEYYCSNYDQNKYMNDIQTPNYMRKGQVNSKQYSYSDEQNQYQQYQSLTPQPQKTHKMRQQYQQVQQFNQQNKQNSQELFNVKEEDTFNSPSSQSSTQSPNTKDKLKKARINTSHVPLNMFNSLHMHLIKIYSKIACKCAPNSPQSTVEHNKPNYTFDFQFTEKESCIGEQCKRCHDLEVLTQIKKSPRKNIQTFRTLWQSSVRIQKLSENFLLHYSQTRFLSNTQYRSSQSANALYSCLPTFLDGSRNYMHFYKLQA